jgi:hypothetical protein
MKINIFQYKPEIIRKITKSSKIVGKWFEGYSGIIIFGQKILGISLQRGIAFSSSPHKYQYQYLGIWVYLLSWPILIELRWGKILSNIGKK